MKGELARIRVAVCSRQPWRQGLPARWLCASSSGQAPGRRRPLIDLGKDVVDQIDKYRKILGPRSVVILPNPGSAEEDYAMRTLTRLRAAGIDVATFSMKENERYPTTEAIDHASELARRMGAQSVVGVGGGAVIDFAKAVAGVACGTGKCQGHLRVFNKEVKITEQPLPVIAVPTTASVGAALSPRTLIVYKPEEALVPLWAEDLGVHAAVVDPEATKTVDNDTARVMALAALSVCFDAIVDASESGTLGQGEAVRLSLGGATALGKGLQSLGAADASTAAASRLHLCEGGISAGHLHAITDAPPIQLLARCTTVLFPQATYTQLCAILFRAYLSLMAEDSDFVPVNEKVVGQFAEAVTGQSSIEALAEWVDGQCKSVKLGTLGDYTEQERSPEKLAEQVAQVLDLFEVDVGESLDNEVVKDVLELSMG